MKRMWERLFDVGKDVYFKIAVSVPVGTFFFFQDWWKIIFALMIIIALDTILGMWVAIKQKKFSSWKMGRVGGKISKYGIALGTVYALALCDRSLFSWALPYLGTFFVITEVVSNFEKLSLLGLDTPTLFLSKINDQFKELYQAKKSPKRNEKEVIDKIMDKKDVD